MIRNLKKNLREQMAANLAKLSSSEVELQTEKIFEKVIRAEWYKKCERISIYVSTTGEVQTDMIIRHALKEGKKVFIPQFTKGSNVMDMVELPSEAEFDSLPATLWGIRQPKVEWNWEKYQKTGPFDVVLLPGVAFTTDGLRLGHGKGYYDRMLAGHFETFQKNPYRAALVLNEQIVEEVPITETDVIMDELILA